MVVGCEDKKQQEPAEHHIAPLAEAPASSWKFTSEFCVDFFHNRFPSKPEAPLMQAPSCKAFSSVGSQPADVSSQPAGVLPPAVASVEGEESKTKAAKTKGILLRDRSGLLEAPLCLRDHSGLGAAEEQGAAALAAAQRGAAAARAAVLLAAAKQGAAAAKAQLSPPQHDGGRYIYVKDWVWTRANALSEGSAQRNPHAQPKRETGHAQDKKEKHADNKRGHGEMEKEAAKDQGLVLYYTIQHHTITYSTFIWYCVV